jgi:alkylation response protein AidB-like acyl-CoA dehydrogenase
MDFTLTEEQRFFQENVRRALKELVLPHAGAIDGEGRFPLDLFRKFGALGYFGLRYPEEVGGLSGDCTSFTILAEELASVSLSFAAAVTMQCLMGTDFVHRFGTEDHKKRLLIPALRGEKIGTIAFTEPDCGSDLGAIRTRAVRDGDDFVITGRKLWITSAEVADFVTVVATTDPAKRLRGLAFFLVEKGMPGFSVGQRIEKISVKGSPAAEVILDACRVPSTNLLGIEGKGAEYLDSILSEIRIMISGLGLGLARSGFLAGLAYAREREAFGRSIGDFQMIQDKLAEMETRIECTRLLAYYAASLKDRGLPVRKQAAMAKFYSTETAGFVADQVTRIYGAYGIAEEYPAQRLFRDARFLLYGGGTSEILKMVIARESLKGPRAG